MDVILKLRGGPHIVSAITVIHLFVRYSCIRDGQDNSLNIPAKPISSVT